MKKQNLITLTLIISGLTLNPVMAEAVLTTVPQSQNINRTVSSSIAALLFNRGLEEEVAEALSESFVSEEEEALLAMLIHDLETRTIVSRKDVLEYLSTAALYKQKINFHSYDHLVSMVSQIKATSLDTHTLKQLSQISKMHKELFA